MSTIGPIKRTVRLKIGPLDGTKIPLAIADQPDVEAVVLDDVSATEHRHASMAYYVLRRSLKSLPGAAVPNDQGGSRPSIELDFVVLWYDDHIELRIAGPNHTYLIMTRSGNSFDAEGKAYWLITDHFITSGDLQPTAAQQ